jgi:hypothetical protein
MIRRLRELNERRDLVGIAAEVAGHQVARVTTTG